MTEVQPMKMAAAEALYDTETAAPRSRSSPSARLDGTEEKFAIKIPDLLSFLATGTSTAEVEGINELREQYEQTYGQDPGRDVLLARRLHADHPGDLLAFRLMIGLGMLARHRRRPGALAHPEGPRADRQRWLRRGRCSRCRCCRCSRNSFGWIFTEMGRQPWVVFGLMTTEQRRLARRQRRGGAGSRSSRSPCSTPSWRSSRSG